MTPTLQADPDCARPARASGPRSGDARDDARDARDDARSESNPTPLNPASAPLRAVRRAFDDIDPAGWDELAAHNPYATPFSAWAFHRAWWDAYRANATDETIVVVDPSSPNPDRPIAIVPLMDRHVVEPTDAATHTMIRHGHDLRLTQLPERACVVYFGATYHADYATLLAHPADMPRAAEALVDAFAREAIPDPSPPDPDRDESWAAVDLRRLRQADPATDALATAFGHREIAEGWTLNVEREDVCPVIRLPEGADLDGFLATLGKKERHEIRRKVRRAEVQGQVELVESTDPVADLDAFIDLHQARWGENGLFPPTLGGDQSRVFIRRLFELFGPAAAVAPGRPTIHLGFLTVGGRRIGAEIHFETAGSLLYYNAGIDPGARDLSPGVVLLERLVRRAIDRGKCRVDLMRGDEPYKYEWGAVDEPIQRILVRRSEVAA